MVDDRPDDIGPSPDLGRAKRPPPTIDLEASEVSSEPRNAGDDTQPEHVSQKPSSQERPAAAISAWVVAAAATLLTIAWFGSERRRFLGPPWSGRADSGAFAVVEAATTSVGLQERPHA